MTTAYVNEVDNYGPPGSVKDVLQTLTALDPTDSSNTHIYTYSYDSQNRLTNVKVQVTDVGNTVQTWTQQFDANGNMTKKTYLGASDYIATYSSYNADNQPTSATSSGNYAGKAVSGSATYSYDGNGNLTAITNGGTTEQALSLPQTHTYNASNQDVSGSGTASGSTQTYSFSYSGTNQTDRVSSGSASAVYTSLGLSTETSSSGTNEYVRCSCGLLNSERVGGKSYYYLFDAHGSILGMTDSSGNDVNRYVASVNLIGDYMFYFILANIDLVTLVLSILLAFSGLVVAFCAFFLFHADHTSLRNQKLEGGGRKRWYQRSQFIIALVILNVALLMLTRIPNFATRINGFLFFILSVCNSILFLYGLYIRQKGKMKI